MITGLCDEADTPQFRFSEPHHIAAESGDVTLTRDAGAVVSAADLSDAAALAGEAVGVGQCISLENNDPNAPAPCHIMQVVQPAYNLRKAHTSPVLSHADGSAVCMPAGERVVGAHFYQPIGQSGLRYELWDEKWATSGTFKPDFAKWAGCPVVIVPTGLIRHFGFQLTKMKGNRKAGDAYALLPSEMDNIEVPLHLDD